MFFLLRFFCGQIGKERWNSLKTFRVWVCFLGNVHLSIQKRKWLGCVCLIHLSVVFSGWFLPSKGVTSLVVFSAVGGWLGRFQHHCLFWWFCHSFFYSSRYQSYGTSWATPSIAFFFHPHFRRLRWKIPSKIVQQRLSFEFNSLSQRFPDFTHLKLAAINFLPRL